MTSGAVKSLAPMVSGGVGEPHHVYSHSQKHRVSLRDAGRSEKREELMSAWHRRLMGGRGGGDDDGDDDGGDDNDEDDDDSGLSWVTSLQYLL